MHIWSDELSCDIESVIVSKEAEGLKVAVVLYDLSKKYEASQRINHCYNHGFEEVKLEERDQSRWLTWIVDNQEMLYAFIVNENILKLFIP